MTATMKFRSLGIALDVVVCVVVGYEVANGAASTAGVICGGVALGIVLFVIPARYLLPTALATTLLVPTNYLPVPTILHATSLGVFPLAVWMLRCRRSSKGFSVARILGWALAAWLVTSEIFAPIRTYHGVEWLGLALVAVVGVTVSGGRDFDPRGLRHLYIQITAGLGAYALLETYILHKNLIYGHFYATATPPLVQHWSQYRATTLLGHPIVNGTVFASALTLAISESLGGKNRSAWSVIKILLLVGGLAAADSRGAAAAAAAGVVLAIIFTRPPTRQVSRRLVVLAGVVLTAGVVFVALSARSESQEGQASANERSNVPAQTEEALRGTSLLGAGPGESQAYREFRQLPNAKVALENSYAQLVVSLGVIGAALFLATLISVCIVGLRGRRHVGEACALVAVLVAVAGYNALEDYPNLLVLVAVLVTAVLSGSRQQTVTTPPRLQQGEILEAT